jgi:amino acid adenylation domain-containing protein
MNEAVDEQSSVDWNDMPRDHLQASCYSLLFEAQARQTPESIAVIFQEQQISYQELNRRANQLAHYLRGLGVGPDVRVGLCLERSLDLAVGVLGILKAGGAYVPLDPGYLATRLQFMAEDAQIAVLVTQERLTSIFDTAGDQQRVHLDSDAQMIAEQPTSDPHTGVVPDNLAYIIYTSGSTGRPKGVLVSHRGIANLSQTQIRHFGVAPGCRILQFASLSFDAAVWDMCMAWLSGATLVLAPSAALAPGLPLIDTLRDYAIEMVTLPPAVLAVLPDAHLPALRTIIVAGEACPGVVVERWASGRQFFNAYGPTETTICATISEALSGPEAPPIGFPLPNVSVYLLDQQMQPVPEGQPGELYIGGIGLARGYHNRPDLTAERFVPNPQHEGARLYRTGDLARYRSDGQIEFLGRTDYQVKVRGFRIELGEIENTLLQHPAIREAVVVAHEHEPGQKRLVAYVVENKEQTNKEQPSNLASPDSCSVLVPSGHERPRLCSPQELRSYLSNLLPDYMVPSAFVLLPALPLTSNGKIDRKALPTPEAIRPDLETEFVAPRTPTETALADIWSEVLHLDRVGIHDHFLMLGGHSLAATQVLARIRDRLAVDVPLPTLFTVPTIAELAQVLDDANRAGTMQMTTIPLALRDALLPLTFAQEQVWLLQQLTPTNQSYSAQSTLRFRGPLNVDVLRQSLNALVVRHEILRTTFPEIGGYPVQRINDPWQVTLPVVDLAALPVAEREATVRQVITAEFQASFDLERLPLIRWTVIRLQADEHLLIHVEHHFVHDGWSYAVFLRELFQLYAAGVTGRAAALPPLPLQFADYAVWQRQWLLSAEAERQRDYWQRKLADVPTMLELPTDYPRPPMQRFQGTSARIELPQALCDAARATAQAEGVTLYMLLLTAFVTLMRRYSGQSDILVGSGVANRRTRETETLIGMIVNMVVLRANLPGNPTARQLLQHVRDVALDAYAHQDLPFEQVVEVVAPPRTLRHNPIFQVAFSFHDSPLPELNVPGLTVEVNEALSNGSAKFDLNIVVIPRAEQRIGHLDRSGSDGITLVWEYNTDLFKPSTIERMVGQFQSLIEQIAANPEQPIGQLALLSEAERRHMLYDWNATAAPYPQNRCIHQLFEAQAARTPDAVAVVFDDSWLSYRELDQQSNQLAHQLQELGVGPGSLIAVYMDRSLEMIAAVLGIIKAGAAYVPFEPSFPDARVNWIMSSLSIGHIITQQTHLHTIRRLRPSTLEHAICLDPPQRLAAAQIVDAELRDQHSLHLWTRADVESHSSAPVASSVGKDDLAYIIFTSGSTGTPKGVMVRHDPVINLIDWVNTSFGVGPADRLLFITSLCFDLSVYDIFGILAAGGSIRVVSNRDIGNAERLLALLCDEPITFWDSAPAALQQLTPLFPSVAERAAHSKLKRVFLSGDWIPVTLPDLIRNTFPGSQVISLGGATEATVWSNYYPIGEIAAHWTSIPYGVPIQNAQYYVLDRHLNPCPVGVPGNLYIAGVCLSSGYANDPLLTAQKFIPNPFGDTTGARMYLTGDRARYWEDGNLEFMGRVDQQVKIRGFRIELGEIETVLSQHQAVCEAVVLAREDLPGSKQLVGYVVLESEAASAQKEELEADLRGFLRERLPEYMLPAAFVFLTALPVTANGKLDRKALPAPDLAHLKATYVAPRTPTEETLAAIWAEVLKLEQPGIHDNFFELGGHSLLATQVVARIRDTFRIEMPLHLLFDSATIAGLGKHIARSQSGRTDLADDAAAPVALTTPIGRRPQADEPIPLSFAQQRLWFLDRFEPGSPAYNICRSLIMRGSLDHVALHGSLSTIVQRHEALRTTFAEDGPAGQPVQVIAPTLSLALPLVDLQELPADTRLAEARRLALLEARQSFDLQHGPLIRARLVRLDDTEHLLVLTIHHSVADGWSMGVLFDELAACYAAAPSGEDATLPDLPIQYADYALWQRQQLHGAALEVQLDYWRAQLADAPPVLELPTDRPRPAIQTFNGALQSRVLPRELAESLAALSRREGVTLFMTLLAAFDVLLQRYSGQDDIVVGSPIAGRTHAETERLIGLFVNTLVLRTRLGGNPTFREVLSRVREVCLGAYAHQDLPFEQLVETLQPPRDPSRTPLFQVLFILQNEQYAPRDLPGLQVRMITEDTGAAAFDLAISLEEQPDGLSVDVQYNTQLFDVTTIARLLDQFHTLLAGVVADPTLSIAALPVLSEAERRQVLHDWNATDTPYLQEQCVHELIAEVARRRPDAVALEWGDQRLSYGELDRRANQLAHYLRAIGVGPEIPTALCLPRSLDMAVALLAILKAGGIYLPLDPGYPADRLRFMLADSQAAVLVTDHALAATFPDHTARVVCLDVEQAQITRQPTTPLAVPVFAEHPAYIIYTSGSTGRPKGVVIPHRALVARSLAAVQHYALDEADRVLQFAALSFDVAAEEMFPTWLSGATLVLWPQPVVAAPHEFQQFVAQAGLSVLNLPTPYWHSWISELSREPMVLPPALRLVVVGSDLTAPEWLARWQQLVGTGVGWHNAYGPTEATITSTLYSVGSNDQYLARGSVPIGRPIANTAVYVLDARMQPVPIGVVGELYIGGAGLARGYLNRPDSTAEKFVPDPFSKHPGARLYRTGDLARYRADGNLEFMGRSDQQVKIRGFRIELGEIEATLLQHPSVRDAAIAAHADESGNKRLVAYIVEHQETSELEAELRHYVGERLPEYMVPAAFMFLEQLPIAASGKLDRGALPKPAGLRSAATVAYVAPRNAAEQVLSDIWADVLALEQIGVHDNFFATGGHSLLATQVIMQIREDFQIDLPLRCMFETPTVAGLAETLLQDPERGTNIEKIARLLVELADLSEEEVDSMLDAESAVSDEDHAK